MHFVGNSAIKLGDGSEHLQLIYSPGYSALSSFIPVLTVFLALVVAEIRHKGPSVRYPCIIVSGIMAGFAIVGMHYTGNMQIANYTYSINWGYFGGAAAISCLAMTIAMIMISKIQDKWLSCIWTRVFCAGLMAVTVTSMHFVASKGITYRLKYVHHGERSLNNNLKVAISISGVTILLCVWIFNRAQKRKAQIKDKAEQVALALLWFNVAGDIMVTQNGYLPCVKITDKHKQQSFNEAFNTGHEAFQWIYKVSHNWNVLREWIPDLTKTFDIVESLGSSQDDQRKTGDQVVNGVQDDYSLIFRGRFSSAAARLAEKLDTPIADLGLLYEGIMLSGILKRKSVRALFSCGPRNKRKRYLNDLESMNGDFGTGQVLFIQKLVKSVDLPKFGSMGYRFLKLETVVSPLANILQVTEQHLKPYLTGARQQALTPATKPRKGVYLACFVLRPGIKIQQFSVLTEPDNNARLPSVYLWSREQHQEWEQYLEHLDQRSFADVMECVIQHADCLDESQRTFNHHLWQSLWELKKRVPEQYLSSATLRTEPVEVPTGSASRKHTSYKIIAFHVLPDIHVSGPLFDDSWAVTPVNFFHTRQQMLADPHDPAFRAQVDTDLSHLVRCVLSTPSIPDSDTGKGTLRAKLISKRSYQSNKTETMFTTTTTTGSFNESIELASMPSSPVSTEGSRPSTASQSTRKPVFVDELLARATARYRQS